MNPLHRLLNLSETEQSRLGVEATPAEIAQQPEMWRDTARRFADAAPAINDLLAQIGLPGGSAEIVFSGAGTSDFVGKCVGEFSIACMAGIAALFHNLCRGFCRRPVEIFVVKTVLGIAADHTVSQSGVSAGIGCSAVDP